MPRLLPAILALAALGALTALLWSPLSTRFTRLAIVVLASLLWLGLTRALWHSRYRPLRFLLPGITLLAALFLVLPARATSSSALRGAYIASLQHYLGVPYYWGGENARGIDCSGLVRRAMVDALFTTGLSTFNPGPLRSACHLWWHDSTAAALGGHHDGLTVPVIEAAPSLNTLDHGVLLPGDLAVTDSGVHILAYLGSHRWIEADMSAARVLILNAPAPDKHWLKVPVKIVRWTHLQQQ